MKTRSMSIKFTHCTQHQTQSEPSCWKNEGQERGQEEGNEGDHKKQLHLCMCSKLDALKIHQG